jgi:hypothetical protein
VHVWANRERFEPARGDVACRSAIRMRLGPDSDPDLDLAEDVCGQDGQQQAEEPREAKCEPSDVQGSLRLSQAPAKWFALAHLDLIKQRNRPVEPPQKPESAPFFLPALAQDIDAGKLQPKNDEAGAKNSTSRVLRSSPGSAMRSPLQTSLELGAPRGGGGGGGSGGGQFEEFTALLQTLTPSGVDFEIHGSSLGEEDEDGARCARLCRAPLRALTRTGFCWRGWNGRRTSCGWGRTLS